MKFLRYLSETVIYANSKELNIIRKAIEEEWKKFNKGKYDRNRTGVNKAMKVAAKSVTKSIKDLEFDVRVGKGWQTKGYTYADTPKHFLGMEYSTKEAIDEWNGDKKYFDSWLDDFMNLVEHELVHIEQFRKILKAKGDIEKVKDVLHDLKSKSHDVHDDKMVAYLDDHLEIMAHAKKADSELSHYDKYELLDMLKKSDVIDNEIAMESSDFSNYYFYMRDEYPKIWRKFLKYLVMFIQKRKDK